MKKTLTPCETLVALGTGKTVKTESGICYRVDAKDSLLYRLDSRKGWLESEFGIDSVYKQYCTVVE